VDYGKTDGVLSANDMGGSSKTDFDVGRKVYVYNLGEANYDQIRKIDVHYEEGPGVGYHLLTGTNLVLNTEFGVNYQVEDRSDHTTSQNFYYRFGEDLTWKLNKQLNLTEKFEFFPRVEDVEQYRLRFESTLSYALILNFSLNLTAIDLYDTRPATAVPPNELQFRTTLGVKF
jgi:putative salt-induced outer membrane protein YdiY